MENKQTVVKICPSENSFKDCKTNIKCPISNCDKIVYTSGSLLMHLSRSHGVCQVRKLRWSEYCLVMPWNRVVSPRKVSRFAPLNCYFIILDGVFFDNFLVIIYLLVVYKKYMKPARPWMLAHLKIFWQFHPKVSRYIGDDFF